MRVRDELVPLSDRLAALAGVRVLIAAVVIWATAVQSPPAGPADVDLVVLGTIWLATTSVLEALRRLVGQRGLLLVSAMLLVDGAFLAVVVAETGGTASGLLYLVHLHVVACTLLTSIRNGVSVAGWHGLLLVTAHHLDQIGGPASASTAALAFTAASFLVVGISTGAFASLNERALRHSRRSAVLLVELGSHLERCRWVEEVLEAGAAHCATAFGNRRVAAGVCNRGEVRGVVNDGTGATFFAAPDGDDLVPGPVRLVAQIDATADPLVDLALPAACNVVVAPLVVDGDAAGMVAVEFGPGRRSLPSRQLDLIVQFADRIALSVRTVQLLAEVESLATSDPLTGLANRRLFDTTLEREIARADRAGSTVALAMLDVDHFKAVNDRHGHQVGDEVLRELAVALRGAARRESLVARYGGEEFVVLFPDAGVEDGEVAAERLRSAAAQVCAVPITVSVGVASTSHEPDAQALVAAADAALYLAKAQGRDRVVCHHHEVPQMVEGA